MQTVAELLDALRHYHLLDDVQRQALHAPGQPADPRALARQLVQRGWLTTFQVNRLFTGRGAELLLGSYVLLELLGEGGMGAVYKARNWKLGAVVALKLIRKDRLTNEAAVRRFEREIRASAQLEHPNIVRALDADAVAGTHFLVMEYVEDGQDLHRRVKEHGLPTVDEACRYMRQAALGLQQAFERGLVHRDIKPHNLLLTGGQVKILDFGLARLGASGDDDSTTLTQEGAVMGTFDYLAPEQARDTHQADIRADLYSLGCTFYFLLCGRPPFAGGTAGQKIYRHQLEAPLPIEQLRPEVPAAVSAIVRKLLAKEPAERYQTPAELAVALERVATVRAGAAPTLRNAPAVDAARTETMAFNPFAGLEQSETTAATPATISTAPPRPAPPRRRATPLLLGVAAGGAALLLAIGIGLLLLRRDSAPEPTDDISLHLPKATPSQKASPPPRASFARLFNGKDLTGWKTHPAAPAGNWRVENGILIGSGPTASYLFSERDDYQDFHLIAEARINDRGNGGILFRTNFSASIPKGYEAQIDSTHRDPIRTGSLHPWSLAVSPEERQRLIVTDRLHAPDEWFTLDVAAQDNRVIIKLNGKTTVDFIDTKRHYTQGHFALQQLDAASRIEFRRVDLAVPSDGWSPLFQGTDLTGWQGVAGLWQLGAGTLRGSHDGLRFNTCLCSAQQYRDFELRFQVKLSEGGNSGVQFRSTILDPNTLTVTGPQADMGGMYWASLYGENFGGVLKTADAALVQRILKKDDFNDYAIKCVGKHVTLKLNGHTTIDDDIPTLPETGVLGWQLHAGPAMAVVFRDIQFKNLSP